MVHQKVSNGVAHQNGYQPNGQQVSPLQNGNASAGTDDTAMHNHSQRVTLMDQSTMQQPQMTKPGVH